MSFPYVPIDPNGWRLAMGMRPLNLATWLQVDEHREEELALKAELLERKYDAVVATEPAGDAASRELLAEVKAFLTAYHPLVSTVTESETSIRSSRRVASRKKTSAYWCVTTRGVFAPRACAFPRGGISHKRLARRWTRFIRPFPGYDGELSDADEFVL